MLETTLSICVSALNLAHQMATALSMHDQGAGAESELVAVSSGVVLRIGN